MIFKLCSAIILLSIFLRTQAQTENSKVEQIIESISEKAGEDSDYSELSDRLSYYQNNRLDLNKVTAEQLQELMFLSELQINAIIRHRSQHGKFAEIFELQTIDEIDQETLKMLLSFCKLTDPVMPLQFSNLSKGLRNQVVFTFSQVLQTQKGYQPDSAASRYLGSPQRLLTRYRLQLNTNLSASLNMEKDAGEPFFSEGRNSGFDFYSGNISYQGTGKIRRVIAGDYSLQFGQGLAMWSGLGFGKGASVANITRNTIGLKQYTSTNESLFLRGLAGSFQYKSFQITPFISSHRIDATENGGEISSLSISGLHRTENELEKKASVRQLIYGSDLRFASGRLKIGTVVYQSTFNKSIAKGADLYNEGDFEGKKLTNASFYYSYNFRNLYCFGEAAHSLKAGLAMVNGVLGSLSPQVSVILMHRNYQKNYHSYFNQAVSEGSEAVNEKGFYSGLIITPDKNTEINVYADFFKFPWLRYRVDAPSSGYEMLSQLSHTFRRRVSVVLRYKLESKQENTDKDISAVYLSDVLKQNARIETTLKISKELQLRSRVEMCYYQKEGAKEEGFVALQDFIYNPAASRISGNLRFALFDTDSFNSRIYAYESDVLYSYSMPAYQNKGTRIYLNGQVRFSKSLDFWARYSITKYSNLDKIGSGLDEIAGNKKSDIKLQLRYKF